MDPYGNHFIIRGMSHPHTWYPTRTSAFAHIKAKGANTIRVVLSSGQQWTKNSASDVSNVIRLCKASKLVCILEVHDTTGFGEQSGAATLTQAVSYWKEIKSALIGQEAYVLINLGNEPYGNNNPTNWINDTKNAIAAMRSAGFQHTLVVDAPNWGQDYCLSCGTMQPVCLPAIRLGIRSSAFICSGFLTQPRKWTITLLLLSMRTCRLSLANLGYLHTSGNPDEGAIMAKAKEYGIGYLAWSWSGNNNDNVTYLDMVTNFDPNQETWWGTRIIHGTNGILETSTELAVYPATTFADVPFSHPYWQDIEILYANGLTGGCAHRRSSSAPTRS